jgi:hypothetical protein
MLVSRSWSGNDLGAVQLSEPVSAMQNPLWQEDPVGQGSVEVHPWPSASATSLHTIAARLSLGHPSSDSLDKKSIRPTWIRAPLNAFETWRRRDPSALTPVRSCNSAVGAASRIAASSPSPATSNMPGKTARVWSSLISFCQRLRSSLRVSDGDESQAVKKSRPSIQQRGQRKLGSRDSVIR